MHSFGQKRSFPLALLLASLGSWGCEPPPPAPSMVLPTGPSAVTLPAISASPTSTTAAETSLPDWPELSLKEDEILGSKACAMCHGQRGQELAASAHADLDGRALGRPAAVRGCELCHGGGRRHMEAPPGRVRREGSKALCGPCHVGKQIEGRHGSAGLTCASCHMVGGSHRFVHPRTDPRGSCMPCHDGKEGEKIGKTRGGKMEERAVAELVPGWHARGPRQR